jgi:tetratricopeptide (TPR) repeat protein
LDPLLRARQEYERGAFGRAVEILGKSEDTESLLLRGVCLARERRFEEAKEVFGQLLEGAPDNFEALTWMSLLNKNRQGIGEAVKYAERAIQVRPDDAAGHGNLGSCYLYLRQPGAAIHAFSRAVELAPDSPEHRHNLGLAFQMDHNHREAIAQFRLAISLAPQAPQSYLALAGQYMQFGIAGKAIECLNQGLLLAPNSASMHTSMAAAFAMIRNDDAAEAHYRKAMELSLDAKAAYASWLVNQGRFDDANALYGELKQQKTLQGLAYYGIMQSRKLTPEDGEFLREMEDARNDPGLAPVSELHLNYALGRAYEQLKQYEQAMASFDRANELAFSIHNAGHPMDLDRMKRDREAVRAYFEAMGANTEGATGGPSPIFIVGMIRSGTTLLEQIVSSHRSVAPAGELRFWVEECAALVAGKGKPLNELAAEYREYGELIAGKAERFTDKMPLNFASLGIIQRCLPDARFIHIRRHPIDTCLSIYSTYFGNGPQFAYSRANIVAYYQQYLETMDFWRNAIPSGVFLEIDYEELIAQPETVIPEIINFCGLPWDEACLHHDQNNAPINTPSRWQARQPMYQSSMDRWKRYEPWLGEFSRLVPASFVDVLPNSGRF